jgi:hypothetical protein
MTEDGRIMRARKRHGETTVSVEDVKRDLLSLGEHTSTGQYGYHLSPDGVLEAEVWNETYHGVKKWMRVNITLTEEEEDVN